jgi:hypothetical protein
MPKTLIVAEKPSVARDISSALPGSFSPSRDKTHLVGDGHVITWAVGQLVGLAPPDSYDPRFKKWRFADLPILPERFTLVPNDERSVMAAHFPQLEIIEGEMCPDCGKPLARRPTSAFTRRVRAGMLDELAGEYRFPSRPDRPVRIRREGDRLVSYASGQRHVLASCRNDALVPIEFDGEGRFRRDARGRVTELIYYEFGKRLGVARKVV